MNILRFFRTATWLSRSCLLVAFLFSLSLLSVRLADAAWTPPSAPPPGGNVSAPINISGAAQTKQGSLTVAGEFLQVGTGDLLVADGDAFFPADDTGIFWTEQENPPDPTKPHLNRLADVVYLSPGENAGSRLELQSQVKITSADSQLGSLVIDNTGGVKTLALTANPLDSGVDIKSNSSPLYLNATGRQDVNIGSAAENAGLCLNDDGTGTNCISGWGDVGGGLWALTGAVIHPTELNNVLALNANTAFDPNTSLTVKSRGNGAGLVLTSSDGTWPLWGVYDTGGNAEMYMYDNAGLNTLTLKTGTIDSSFIQSNLAIGSDNPNNYKLQVTGNLNVTGGNYYHQGNQGATVIPACLNNDWVVGEITVRGGIVTNVSCEADDGGGGGVDNYTVKVTSGDTGDDFLYDTSGISGSLVAGTGVTLTVLNPGANERLQIDVAGGDSLWTGTEGSAIYPKTPTNTKVGVGASTAPASTLHVYPGTTVWGTDLSLDATSLGGGRRWLAISTGGTASEGQGKFLIKDNDASAVRLAIDTAGKVGIGTAAPASLLNLHGQANSPVLLLQNNATGNGPGDGLELSYASAVYLWNYENTSMIFGTYDIERMRILNNGSIGIGIDDPQNRLDVGSASGGYQALRRDDTTIVNGDDLGALYFTGDDGAAGGIGAQIKGRATADWSANDYPTKLMFYTSPDGGTATERMVILENGNVGIGDSSPASLLTVGNSDQFQVDNSGNIIRINNIAYGWPVAQGAAGTFLQNNGGGGLTWAAGGGGIDGSGTVNRIAKFTAGTTIGDSVIYESAGNVGIGTSGVDGKLDVADRLSFDTSTSSPDRAIIKFGDGTGWKLYFGLYNNIKLITFKDDGSVGIGTENPDTRLKIVGATTTDQLALGQGSNGYLRLGSDNNDNAYIASNASHRGGGTWNYVSPTAYSGTATRLSLTGSFAFMTTSGGLNPIGWSTRLFIANDGKVGIGTASPNELLEINGNVRGNQTGALRISTGSGYLDVGPKNTSYAHFYTDRTRYYFDRKIISDGEFSSYSNDDLILQTGETTRITVRGNGAGGDAGKVGIANTSPTSLLTVASGTAPYGNNHTLVAYNNSVSNYDAVAGFKSGSNVTGSGVYGELVSGMTCNGTCAGMYGSEGSGGSNKWSGYFDGRVGIEGLFTLQGLTKPLSIKVCLVGSNICPGRYLYTTGSTVNDLRYYYWNDIDKTIENFLVFALNQCPGGYSLVQANNSGTSYFLSDGCSDEEGVKVSNGTPYRASATNVCRKASCLPKESTNSYRNASGCFNVGPTYGCFYTVRSAGTNQIYELR